MLFNEVVVFTDIHFGMKNNSRIHNDDCESFIKWMVKEAKERGVTDCIFMGDWHHNRAAINVSTLNYTVSNLQFLNDNFDNVYMIMGNHDLYYREKREINSLPMADHYNNITIINDSIFVKDDVAIVPWLVEDEWKQIKNLNVKYIFGHFELPYFYMNAMVQMPDHGSGLDTDAFSHVTKVFSGHFHKRQERGNIIYPGNCFPHNYADAWDDDRGIMFLTWDGEIEYKTWPGAPKYRTIKLSELIDDPETHLSINTYCRVTLDVPISYEEANFIKESFVQQYGIREISLIPDKKEEHSQDWQQSSGDLAIENIDNLVLSQLNDIKSDTIKNSLLVSIYNTLNT